MRGSARKISSKVRWPASWSPNAAAAPATNVSASSVRSSARASEGEKRTPHSLTIHAYRRTRARVTASTTKKGDMRRLDIDDNVLAQLALSYGRQNAQDLGARRAARRRHRV